MSKLIEVNARRLRADQADALQQHSIYLLEGSLRRIARLVTYRDLTRLNRRFRRRAGEQEVATDIVRTTTDINEAGNPISQLVVDDLPLELQEIVELLPHDQQETLALSLDGLTTAEISQVMGIAPSTSYRPLTSTSPNHK